MSSRRTIGHAAVIAACLIVWTTPAGARPKTDIVVVENGDHLTCEIKGLSRGMLTVKTDAMGTVDIKWEHVVQVESRYAFQVEADDGLKYFGLIELPADEDVLRIARADAVVGLDRLAVVRITPINDTFLSRVDGSLSVGFSFTKSSDVAQTTLSFNSKYRTRRYVVGLDLSAIFTSQETKTTQRQDHTLSYQRLFKRKAFAIADGKLQQNDDLGIDLRTLLSLSLGLNTIKTNRTILAFSLGVAASNEWAAGSTESQASVEGVITTGFEHFRYDSPKTDLTVGLTVFPSLTESKRYRLDFQTKLRHELVTDFFWDLTFYDTYDSRPPETATRKNDLGIVTSLGWTF